MSSANILRGTPGQSRRGVRFFFSCCLAAASGASLAAPSPFWGSARCVFATVDPVTGEKAADGEPLRTLARVRRINGKAMFGQNVMVRRPGTLRVGDAVEVLD